MGVFSPSQSSSLGGLRCEVLINLQSGTLPFICTNKLSTSCSIISKHCKAPGRKMNSFSIAWLVCELINGRPSALIIRKKQGFSWTWLWGWEAICHKDSGKGKVQGHSEGTHEGLSLDWALGCRRKQRLSPLEPPSRPQAHPATSERTWNEREAKHSPDRDAAENKPDESGLARLTFKMNEQVMEFCQSCNDKMTASSMLH